MDLNDTDERIQGLYARWLDAGSQTAFAVTLAAFLVYLLGMLPAYVPLDALPGLWGLPVDEYVRRTHSPTGWAWLGAFDYADYLNLGCIALISGVSIACYARVAPEFLRAGARLEAAVAAGQVLVLLAAASGFFG